MSLSGLSNAGARQVLFALSGAEDTAKSFGILLRVIESLSRLAEDEMVQTRADLSYWRDLAESVEVAGSIELLVARLHAYVGSFLYPLLSMEEESAEAYIFNVETTFKVQCLLLARIKFASDCLKLIYSSVSRETQTDSLVLRSDAGKLLSKAIDVLYEALLELVPRATITSTVSSTTTSILDRCIVLERCIDSLQQGTKRGLFRGADRYPLGIMKVGRRPQEYQSRWLGDLSKVLLTGASLDQLYRYRCYIKEKAQKVFESVSALWSEYLLKASAMTELLAKAASKGAAIITESEVMDARANLATALNNWAMTEHGTRSLLQFYTRTEKGTVSEMEAQMGALRHAFEQDIKRPFTGIVGGTLLSSIFIQGLEIEQKMLEAMLQADAAMTKNQLTMLLTSILPGFVLVASLWWIGRSAVYPLMLAAQDGGHLRELLSELEDSMIEVSSYLDAQEVPMTVPSSPRRSSQSLLSPPSLSSSAAAEGGATISYTTVDTERRLEVDRGRLCFDLLRLKRGLAKHYKARTIWDRLFHACIEPLSIINYLPFRLMYRLWSGRSVKRQGSREYATLSKDLDKLESPEISRATKLSLLSKLKLKPVFRGAGV